MRIHPRLLRTRARRRRRLPRLPRRELAQMVPRRHLRLTITEKNVHWHLYRHWPTLTACMQKIAFSGFAWDKANHSKCQEHGVSVAEVEHVLVHAATLIVPDLKNSRGAAFFGDRADGNRAIRLCRFHAKANTRRNIHAAHKLTLHAQEGDQKI